MTKEEYWDKVHRMAEVSRLLTLKLDEDGQDLFEEYGNLWEEVVRYDTLKNLYLSRNKKRAMRKHRPL